MVGKAKELQLELRHLGGQRTECASTDPAMLYYFKYKASCGAECWLIHSPRFTHADKI